jgi:hypothetical protein
LVQIERQSSTQEKRKKKKEKRKKKNEKRKIEGQSNLLMLDLNELGALNEVHLVLVEN